MPAGKESGEFIDDFATDGKIDLEKAARVLDKAVEYNSFEEKDKTAILEVYDIKRKKAELKSPIEDKVACIEEVARLYRAQKRAFEDVLTKKGFEPTEEVLKTYEGRIGILTNHGTLIILGKLKRTGRLVTMDRIHSPIFNIYNHQRGHLKEDLKLGEQPYLSIGYKGSPARALAVNPHGADDDELEARDANNTVYGIGLHTMIILLQPREEPVKEVPKEEPEKVGK
jgi:hypothetical protein